MVDVEKDRRRGADLGSAPFMAGASIVEGPMFSPSAVLDFLDMPLQTALTPSSLARVPTNQAFNAGCPKRPLTLWTRFLPGGLERVYTSAPIPRALLEEFLRGFRIPLHGHGITELGGPLTFSR